MTNAIKLTIAAVLMGGLIHPCIAQPPTRTVWLDQLDLSVATQGYGVPKKNRSVEGHTLTIAGKTFERGFGTHAESSLLIQLDGKATGFVAQVGIDDEVKEHQPAVEFVLVGDGKNLWSSGVMRLGDQAKSCKVPLIGVKRLELVVTDGGNGNYYDHADWADAKFETNGGNALATISPVPRTPYILTPPPSPSPKINSASVFGVRPGSPFQFLVAATGDRPMKFSATGLPAGLKIDAATGIITGQLSQKGTFQVVLAATNGRGKTKKQCVSYAESELHLRRRWDGTAGTVLPIRFLPRR